MNVDLLNYWGAYSPITSICSSSRTVFCLIIGRTLWNGHRNSVGNVLISIYSPTWSTLFLYTGIDTHFWYPYYRFGTLYNPLLYCRFIGAFCWCCIYEHSYHYYHLLFIIISFVVYLTYVWKYLRVLRFLIYYACAFIINYEFIS